MTTMAEAYGYEDDSNEFFDEMEFADEATRRRVIRPIRPIPGALTSATLQTPRGPATLNLPAPVATLAQFRALEQAVNSTSQRMTSVQAELMRVRRELAIRRRDPQGQSSMMMTMFTLLGQKKLRDDLQGHTHPAIDKPPTLPASSSSGLTSMLPLMMMMQPNMFGGSASGGAGASQDNAMGMSPIMMFAMMQFLD